jgi:hypothetical protein
MLNLGADVEAREMRGTPLDFTVKLGHCRITELIRSEMKERK